MRYSLLIALIVGAACAAEPANKPAEPRNPSVHVPAVKYQSAFADYRSFGVEKISPWKAANDEVGRIGGWRVYAREAREPDPAAPATSPSPPNSKPAPDAPPKQAPGGHGGHKMN